ncbi:SPASM domain-containing protein [Aceticella autotrophica]|uniref:SPASM domain-containing protein n=1 Tax=Aceticella autotrophica TaxID=2755338 RepID=A0A975GBF5_9THEO|nr:radical SAM protein [Aceticella autotrophica]QSZ28121.1 SPASM domain-containing protein [Aceticella autotrophica]
MDLTLQIEPTRMCNLDCSICMRKNIKKPINSFLTFNNFKKICDNAVLSKMFQYIGLHGWGEPLLNKELFKMVEYAEDKGLATNLTTNGRLINERFEEIFKSGLREIAFGVYNKNLLREVVPSIRELIKIRNHRCLKIPKTYFDITICKESLSDIQNFIEIAQELRIDAVILHRLFNVYKVDPSVKYISQEEEKMLFEKVKEIGRKNGMEIYLPVRHKYPCKVVKYSIFITVDGDITPCCFLPEYTLGNIFEMELSEVFASDGYKNFKKRMPDNQICGRCRW